MLIVFLHLLSASQLYFKILFLELGVVWFDSQFSEPSFILSHSSENSWAPFISAESVKGAFMGNMIAVSSRVQILCQTSITTLFEHCSILLNCCCSVPLAVY